MTPARKLTHNSKFEHFWMQKDMNFGNAIIICHFGPEKRQKSNPERHKFWEHHNYLSFGPEKRQKSNPERLGFREHHDFLSLWARETPKILPRKTQILGMP